MLNDDDDNALPRARWIPWAIGLLVLSMVVGMGNIAWMMLTNRLGPSEKSPPPASATPPAPVTAPVPFPASAPQASGTPPVAPAPGMPESPAPQRASASLKQPEGMPQCMRCHSVQRNLVGPSFVAVAGRYQGREGVENYLIGKIRQGSVGEWGRVIMPRQVWVSEGQAQAMAQWIMALPVPARPPQTGS